jgi:hypothetical protein
MVHFQERTKGSEDRKGWRDCLGMPRGNLIGGSPLVYEIVDIEVNAKEH